MRPVLTICWTKFVSGADIQQTAFAQLRLPPEEVSLNETAANNTISSSTNDTTDRKVMQTPFLAKNRIRIR